ncbi:flagellar export chaperone FliS [Sporolactobacillus sp. CQH2019]|uniref:flagellar export chaperone FliS n=1 Tax=Sporolactobacillus sp. CQH2019 TaxID=3023512 RepID=UPI002368573C|nr:flagellar export chaperone FliS [Sporolactobacillus sp. CQH2019]MDD9148073.1 flagellar export chaperone FliS [Sporolactobacillus sp. CQH2019]
MNLMKGGAFILPANAYKAYQRNSILTATQGELTLMLYNGCIKFIRQARMAIDNHDIAGKNTYLQKAQAIISELMATLDQKQPIAQEMMRLYDFVNRSLIAVNMKDDRKLLDSAENIMVMFRDTWKQVIEITQKKQPKRDRV